MEPPPSHTPPEPQPEADIYAADTKAIFEVPYEDILSGNTDTVLSALRGFLTNRERVVRGRNKITLLFAGYDDDPRDVYNIPEIRRYAKALDEQFPYWFYFADLDQGTLKVLALCLCRIVKVPGGSTSNGEDLKTFLLSHIVALNQLCATFALPEGVKNQATDEALAVLVPPGGRG
ncbi:MAG: chlororespiratory reduction 6 domain-containing protein [Limisphaerales bacterium]